MNANFRQLANAKVLSHIATDLPPGKIVEAYLIAANEAPPTEAVSAVVG